MLSTCNQKTASTHLVSLVQQDADVVALVSQVVRVALLCQGPIGLLNLVKSGIVVDLSTQALSVQSVGCCCDYGPERQQQQANPLFSCQ